MDLKQLRYFCAVFERKNLSHAAQQCCVAQSAISHHVSNLEEELGTRLFTRQARGMEPTPAGARLYEHAQSIFRSLAAAASDVHQLAEEITGELNLGLPHTIIDAIAEPLLRSLLDELPHARVIIHEAFSSELYRQLIQGEHDLVFCYNAPHDERVKTTLVHDEPLCAVGIETLVGPANVPISMDDALRLPQVTLRRGDDARSISNQPRLTQGLHNQAVFQLNSVNGMRKAICAGIGTTVCPLITVRDLVEARKVVARPIVQPVSSRSLYALRLADRLPTRLMEAVQRLVLALIRQQTAVGRWPVITDR